MPITVTEFQKLKDRMARMRREADKAEGVHEEVMRQLKEEFDVDTITEAEKLLKSTSTRVRTLDRSFNKQLAEFNKVWGDV